MTRSVISLLATSVAALGASAAGGGGPPLPPTGGAPTASAAQALASPSAAATAVAPAVSAVTCVEHLPAGKARPALTEQFPARGVSGHKATLHLTLKHGKGERVLPGALAIQSEGDAAKALRAAGFMLPDVSGPGRPRVKTQDSADGSVTQVRIAVVPLPGEAGRHDLVLPPLPLAIARASGEVITLCTASHNITVEDPVANKPMAMPKANPSPQRQIEAWHALRNTTYGAAAGLILASLLALIYRWWRQRPKTMPPPLPPRPAWELALESLYDIRQARLIEQGRLHDHFDRVSHTLKEYLGRRFAFDGLESTTHEILSELRVNAEAVASLPLVRQFLSETDLVKFAKQTPTEDQCRSLLDQAEAVVRGSTPTASTVSAKAESP